MSKGTVRKKIFAKGSRSSGGGDPTIPGRVTNLENNEYKIAYFTEINSQTGTITIPTGATILLDQLPKGADALVSTKDATSGIPTGENPKTTLAEEVDVATFDASGNYTLTGDCSSYPVCLIYWLSIKAVDYSSLNINNILEEQLQSPKVLDLDYANVNSETIAGNLIDGQFYRITNFPATTAGIQLYDAIFQATYFQGAAFPILSQFGKANNGSPSFYVEVTMDWYGAKEIIGVYVPAINNTLTKISGSPSNAIDILNWGDPVKMQNSTLKNTYFDKPATNPTITIINSILESDVTINCNNFDNLNISSSYIGSNSVLHCVTNGHTISDLACESNAVIYVPYSVLGAVDVGSTGVLGDASGTFISVINCSIGMNSQIIPDTDNAYSLVSCSWSNAKSHVIKQSYDSKVWFGRYNDFDLTVDVDSAVSGGSLFVPSGYGIIRTYSGTGTPTTITDPGATVLDHNFTISNNDGTAITLSNAGGIIAIIGGLASVKLANLGDNVSFIDNTALTGTYNINSISKY